MLRSTVNIVARLVTPQFLWVALWAGLGVFTIVLILLLLTRWGHKQPVQKSTVLALWFHLLLLIYATSITVVAGRHGPGNQVTVNLEMQTDTLEAATPPKSPSIFDASKRVEPLAAAPASLPRTQAPRAAVVADERPDRVNVPSAKLSPSAAEVPAPKPPPSPQAVVKTPPPSIDRPQPKRAETAPRVAARTPPSKAPPSDKPAVELPRMAQPAARQPAVAQAAPDDSLTRLSKPAALTDIPEPTAHVAPMVPVPMPDAAVGGVTRREPSPLDLRPSPSMSTSPDAAAANAVTARLVPPIAGIGAVSRPSEAYQTPSLYQQRTAADRERIALTHGGSAKTEAAVDRALRWLASSQEADGRWNPARFGAGQETQVLGHDRGGAGARAETGISGLALLAFLGAGHTHRRGDHQATVRRGLQYLIDAQHPNGHLGGNAEPFAFMYCHGMAALALSEALAMTGDPQLREPVRRAIDYTIAAQNKTTGGWRYRPGDTGDLSQLGWQLMALKSAELGGIEIPPHVRNGMLQFVRSVSSGSYGGLASYRPGEQVSRTMTAEALVCRQFLGMPRDNPAGDEAGNFLHGELPGAGPRNFYYWYYGTLGMYQLQGDHWRQWNDALTRQLLDSQSADGDLSGSWEPNDVWGGYGGRVYSTALATLCLEVYYRYLPLYVEAAANGQTQRK